MKIGDYDVAADVSIESSEITLTIKGVGTLPALRLTLSEDDARKFATLLDRAVQTSTLIPSGRSE